MPLRRLPRVVGEAQLSGGAQTRASLLDAGAALAEEHGLTGISVNMVVARAGVAKGTFYVHFKDRAGFIDAMHARFHADIQTAIEDTVAGIPPGAERLYRSLAHTSTYRSSTMARRRSHSRLDQTRPAGTRCPRDANATSRQRSPTSKRWAGTSQPRRRNSSPRGRPAVPVDVSDARERSG